MNFNAGRRPASHTAGLSIFVKQDSCRSEKAKLFAAQKEHTSRLHARYHCDVRHRSLGACGAGTDRSAALRANQSPIDEERLAGHEGRIVAGEK